jgi:hypothetical protein
MPQDRSAATGKYLSLKWLVPLDGSRGPAVGNALARQPRWGGAGAHRKHRRMADPSGWPNGNDGSHRIKRSGIIGIPTTEDTLECGTARMDCGHGDGAGELNAQKSVE